MYALLIINKPVTERELKSLFSLFSISFIFPTSNARLESSAYNNNHTSMPVTYNLRKARKAEVLVSTPQEYHT